MRKFLIKCLLRIIPKWLMFELFYAYYLKEVYDNQKITEEKINNFWNESRDSLRNSLKDILGSNLKKSSEDYKQKLRNFSEEEIKDGLLSDEEWNSLTSKSVETNGIDLRYPDYNKNLDKDNSKRDTGPIMARPQQIELGRKPKEIG